MDIASFKSEAYSLPLNKSVTVRLNSILWRHLYLMAQQNNTDVSLVTRFLVTKALRESGVKGIL